jgi:hypothetical protein
MDSESKHSVQTNRVTISVAAGVSQNQLEDVRGHRTSYRKLKILEKEQEKEMEEKKKKL